MLFLLNFLFLIPTLQYQEKYGDLKNGITLEDSKTYKEELHYITSDENGYTKLITKSFPQYGKSLQRFDLSHKLIWETTSTFTDDSSKSIVASHDTQSFLTEEDLKVNEFRITQLSGYWGNNFTIEYTFSYYESISNVIDRSQISFNRPIYFEGLSNDFNSDNFVSTSLMFYEGIIHENLLIIPEITTVEILNGNFSYNSNFTLYLYDIDQDTVSYLHVAESQDFQLRRRPIKIKFQNLFNSSMLLWLSYEAVNGATLESFNLNLNTKLVVQIDKVVRPCKSRSECYIYPLDRHSFVIHSGGIEEGSDSDRYSELSFIRDNNTVPYYMGEKPFYQSAGLTLNNKYTIAGGRQNEEPLIIIYSFDSKEFTKINMKEFEVREIDEIVEIFPINKEKFGIALRNEFQPFHAIVTFRISPSLFHKFIFFNTYFIAILSNSFLSIPVLVFYLRFSEKDDQSQQSAKEYPEYNNHKLK
jgi:hypothetical protein